MQTQKLDGNAKVSRVSYIITMSMLFKASLQFVRCLAKLSVIVYIMQLYNIGNSLKSYSGLQLANWHVIELPVVS